MIIHNHCLDSVCTLAVLDMTHTLVCSRGENKCLTLINLEHCLPADGQIVYDFVESQLALFAEKSAFIQ